MSLPAILTALEAMGLAVAGVAKAFDEIPDHAPAGAELPAWVVTSKSGAVQFGNSLRYETHAITGHLLYARGTDFYTEKSTVNGMLDDFLTKMGTTMTLGGLTFGFDFDDPAYVTEDPVTIKNESYMALTFNFLLKEKTNVTPSG